MIPMKNIEELNLMTKEEIHKHRDAFLSSIDGKLDWHGTEFKRYIDELELYITIRFVDDFFARMGRYRNDSEVSKLFKNIKDESLYLLTIYDFLEDYGKTKYIHSINDDLGIELRNKFGGEQK